MYCCYFVFVLRLSPYFFMYHPTVLISLLYRIYSLIRRGFFLEISGSNWGARLLGVVYRDRK